MNRLSILSALQMILALATRGQPEYQNEVE